jgi:hypothetical protein
MKIVVTHLTRMQRGTVCVAGLGVETGQHVRPVQPMGVLQSRVTMRRGGPLDTATIVDLGLTRPFMAREGERPVHWLRGTTSTWRTTRAGGCRLRVPHALSAWERALTSGSSCSKTLLLHGVGGWRPLAPYPLSPRGEGVGGEGPGLGSRHD